MTCHTRRWKTAGRCAVSPGLVLLTLSIAAEPAAAQHLRVGRNVIVHVDEVITDDLYAFGETLCQGRSKIRPRWRRKTRPAGHWTECLKAAVRGKASGPRGGRVLAGVLAVCEAIAVAVQLQDVDVMGESVEECPG